MRDHKSLIAWQRAHEVAAGVTRLVRSRSRWDPILSQLQRAAISVQLNIAEGYALRTIPRYRSHLTIALGSAVETLECLELGLETGILARDEVEALLAKANETRALLLGLLNHLRQIASKQKE
ncbi:MAG: four helix bundle protein [Gemmatimonadales bacterium]